MPRVLHHAQKTEACGTLLVTKWPSAPFWPMLLNKEGKGDLPSLLATHEINKLQVIISPDRFGSNLFKGKTNTNLLAIRLEFRKTEGSKNLTDR